MVVYNANTNTHKKKNPVQLWKWNGHKMFQGVKFFDYIL